MRAPYDAKEMEISVQLASVTRALTHQHQQGAVAPGTYGRLLHRQYQLRKEQGEITGIRTLHLVCGHVRKINVATYEEEDMERTGTVQCRAIKRSLGWPEHRHTYVGVLGWDERPVS